MRSLVVTCYGVTKQALSNAMNFVFWRKKMRFAFNAKGFLISGCKSTTCMYTDQIYFVKKYINLLLIISI